MNALPPLLFALCALLAIAAIVLPLAILRIHADVAAIRKLLAPPDARSSAVRQAEAFLAERRGDVVIKPPGRKH